MGRWVRAVRVREGGKVERRVRVWETGPLVVLR